MKTSAFLFIALVLLSSPSSQAGFLEGRAQGWHWYEDRLKKDEKEAEKQSSEPIDASKQLDNLKAEIEKRLHTAIIDPTEANLIAYMQLQKQLMAQSQKFSDVWQRVLYTHPELDETLSFPVTQGTRHVYLDQERESKEQAIKALAARFGLVYFFKGDCPYCHAFAPVVKRFAEKHGWSVLAVSLDASSLAEFPQAQPDNGIAANLGVQVVPALLAVHPATKQSIPLAYGMISESEIETRLSILAKGLQ